MTERHYFFPGNESVVIIMNSLVSWSGTILVFLLVSVMLDSSVFFASAFLSPGRSWSLVTVQQPMRISPTTLECDGSKNNYDDDDEQTVKPYRNRSLAWTNRYRKLNPYEKVRARVIHFGHRSKDDWDDAASSGQLGQYVPTYPDEMYAPEWVSWDEWLGLMRSYDDTKNLATNILGLKSLDDYLLFAKSDPKRAGGLRIPARPDLVYKDEWIDEESFFGTH